MNPKKTPDPTKAEPSATHRAIVPEHQAAEKAAFMVPLVPCGILVPSRYAAFTPRQERALDLLKPGQWVTREQLDRGAGASNSPDLIQQLRRKLGYDAIETQHFDAVDRDGKPCRPGRYRLTEKGRERLADWCEVAE